MESDFLAELSSENYEIVTTQIKPLELYRSGNLKNENSAICPSDAPFLPVYLSAVDGYGIALFTIGGVAVLVVITSYIDTIRHIMKNSPPQFKKHSAFVLTVYPVIAIATYCGILIPRANVFAEVATQIIIMASMHQLFCLFVAYSGGQAEIIRKVTPDALNMKVLPCCCWPCLPILDVNKGRMKRLRLLVLQMPAVHGLIYLMMLILWAERENLYEDNYIYFQPVFLISILSGVWGMRMTMGMLKDILKDYGMLSKFKVLQVVLLLAKAQGYVTLGLSLGDVLPCKPPFTPSVYRNLIQNTLLLFEIVLLSIIARKLYKKELPKTTESNSNIEEVCIHVSTIENIMKSTAHTESESPTYLQT